MSLIQKFGAYINKVWHSVKYPLVPLVSVAALIGLVIYRIHLQGQIPIQGQIPTFVQYFLILVGLIIVVSLPVIASNAVRPDQEPIWLWSIGVRWLLPLIVSAVFSYCLAESKDKPVYFLAFAALWIGAMHLTEFKEAHIKLDGANKDTKALVKDTKVLLGDTAKLTEDTAKLITQTETLLNLWGFTEYRAKLQEAYKTETDRILSVADYWSIDDEWWLLSNLEWEKCPLYMNLMSGRSPSQTVFVGRMPWPKCSEDDKDDTIQLTPPEFQRIIGLTWRLVIASKVRKARNEQGQGKVRVLVGSVPVAATVVGNDVFTLLVSEADETASRGTKITGHDTLQKEPADAYERMIRRYLRHARSGREYVISLLRLSAIASPSRWDTSPGTDGEPDRVLKSLGDCLKTLGMEEWANQTGGWSNTYRGGTENMPDKAGKEKKCIELFRAFLTCYVPTNKSNTSEIEKPLDNLTFQHLGEQLQ